MAASDSNLRVAILIYGQPRFLMGVTSESILRLVKEYNADVFYHTYWTKEDVGKDYPTAIKLYDGNPVEVKALPETDLKLENLYSPKGKKYDRIQNDPIDHTKLTWPYQLRNQWDEFFYYNIRTMWKSIYECNKLKSEYENENNFRYDWVIRCRFDEVILDIPNLTTLDKNIVYIPNNVKGSWYSKSDLLSISSSTNSDKICDVYTRFYEIANRMREICAEGFFGFNMQILHDLPVCLDSRIRFKLIRKFTYIDDDKNYYKLEWN